MDLIMQGMRRSGTTIVYDVLSQDPAFDACYYEPFSKGKVGALGGGSGVQPRDLMNGVRKKREQIIASSAEPLVDDDFNLGAPLAPEKEIAPQLPGFALEYLKTLRGNQNGSLIKFTRAYNKLPAIAPCFPGSVFVMLLRDPRAVVSSYLFGKGRIRAQRYPDADHYFAQKSEMNPWNARKIAFAAARQQGVSLAALTDVELIVWLWAYKVGRTLLAAHQVYAERFLVLWHDQFCQNPVATLQPVYQCLGRPAPDVVQQFAEQHVRAPKDPDFADDARWSTVYDNTGCADILHRLSGGDRFL